MKLHSFLIACTAIAMLLSCPRRAHAAEIEASDGAAFDLFGSSVSESGNIGLVGAQGHNIGANNDQGSAYVFRNLDTATGTVTQNVKLTASDGAPGDSFGDSVGHSGNIGLVGASLSTVGANRNQGSAYVFRNLDAATGTVTQNVKLTASDGAASHRFGISVSQSGSIGLVGASGSSQGSAYVFRNLDIATGTVTQNVKLTASDGASGDRFGSSVSLFGSIGLVGAFNDDVGANTDQGSAYVFRNMDTALGTVTQNVKLTASDGAFGDLFGSSVSLSGSIGLVGAYWGNVGANNDQGSAYMFRNLDTATGTVTQNLKLTASDGAADDQFGSSVSLNGDQFVVGARFVDGVVPYSGKAYTGSVSSMSALDVGNASRTIDGISFISQDDWIIGETTDSNAVTLSAGDSATVTNTGRAVYIGKNAGSDNNHLIVAGNLTANQITIGAAGNAGNVLQLGDGGTTGTLSTASVITNNGTFAINRSNAVVQGTDFSGAALTGTGSFHQAGSGTTTLNAANSYTGNTTITNGTLVLNGSSTSAVTAVESGGTFRVGTAGSLTGNVEVAAGGALTGGGTIIGNTSIAGTHSVGASPGLQGFTGDLGYESTANSRWELASNTDNSLLRGGLTGFDGINVSGNLNIAAGATIDLVFNATGSAVSFANDFWDTDRSWTFYDVGGATIGSFSLGTVSLDSTGASLASIRTDASFAITSSGSDVLVSYYAIPEPTASILIMLGGAACLLMRRKRSPCVAYARGR